MRLSRLALRVAERLLPPEWREPIIGDLEEEWRAAARPSRLRFGRLLVGSIAACWLDRLRRDPSQAARRARHHTGDPPMRSLLQDLRYGARLMRRNPGFTMAAVATLALGIGANSAIFSLVNVMSLKPLPYSDPDRVAFVLGWNIEDNEMRFNLRQADVLDLRREATSLDAVSAYTYVSANLTGGDLPDRVQAYRVTPNTFALLGVRAEVGRTFDEADAASDRFDLAVISHGLWQRRFAGDPSIVGRRILVNGQPHEVIGVMPSRFEFPVFNFKGDLWLPWAMRNSERGGRDATGGATVIARLGAGRTYASAQAEIDVVMRGLAERHPDTNSALGARLIQMGRLDDEQAGPGLVILLVTVDLVLVLACANVANLLLARGVARQRELAVRAAIGASRTRIARQLLVEGVLLAIAGGICGVLLAVVALDGIRAVLPEALLATVPNIDEIGVDRTTLGYTLLISLLTSAMFGALPAWRASRERFESALRESAAAGGSRHTRRLRSALVISEVALATVLLVAAGLLARSYGRLQAVSPGFDPSGVMTVAATLPDYRYPDRASQRRFFEALIEGVERLPGVVSVGLVNVLPFSTYDNGSRMVVEGAAMPAPGREPSVAFRIASPGYLDALRIPLVDGRFFDRSDTADGARVAVVNEAAVARYLGGCDPPRPDDCRASALGRRVRLGNASQPWLTIVGVVGNVRHTSVMDDPQPEVYVPMAQSPAAMMMLAVRVDTRPEDMAAPIRAVVQAIDATQPVYHVKTLEALAADALLPSRISAQLMVVFGGVALLLATLGIYGVMAYGVSQQTREFGVRLALGATRRTLVAQVLRRGAAMVGTGVLLGILGALGVSMLLQSLLFGVSPGDPVTFLLVAGLLAASGLVACAVPAWRASVTAPVHALRTD